MLELLIKLIFICAMFAFSCSAIIYLLGSIYAYFFEKKAQHKAQNATKAENDSNTVRVKDQAPLIMQSGQTTALSSNVVVQDEPENVVGEDASVYLGSADAFMEDACIYKDEQATIEAKYKVKKYLPKPAKDDYRSSSTAPKTRKNKKLFVEVQFPSRNKRYDYLCDIADIKLDDYVLVPAGNEQKEGKVVGVKYRTFAEMPLPARYYKKVISKCEVPKNNKIEPYYVLVAFEAGGKEYTYKCDLPNICIGDYVRVIAQRVEKTVRVEDIAATWAYNIRSKVLRLATDEEVWLWRYPEDAEKYAADDDDEEVLEIEPEPNEDDYEPTTSYESEESGNSSDSRGVSICSLGDDDDDSDKSSSCGLFGLKYESLTDEKGYMRDGKAEEYEKQIQKAIKLGRLTDDRGFIIDPYYAQRLRENFAYEEMYSNGEVDEEEE